MSNEKTIPASVKFFREREAVLDEERKQIMQRAEVIFRERGIDFQSGSKKASAADFTPQAESTPKIK
jgi:hypothetical protein